MSQKVGSFNLPVLQKEKTALSSYGSVGKMQV